MSQANVEQFIQQVAQDAALQEQLKPSTSMKDFQTKMVELGKQKGCIFGEEDVASYMHAQVAQTTGRSPSEKLTEEELETVGGGTPTLILRWTPRITPGVVTVTVSHPSSNSAIAKIASTNSLS